MKSQHHHLLLFQDSTRSVKTHSAQAVLKQIKRRIVLTGSQEHFVPTNPHNPKIMAKRLIHTNSSVCVYRLLRDTRHYVFRLNLLLKWIFIVVTANSHVPIPTAKRYSAMGVVQIQSPDTAASSISFSTFVSTGSYVIYFRSISPLTSTASHSATRSSIPQ